MALLNKMQSTDYKALLGEAINNKDSEKFLNVVNDAVEAKAEAILEDAVHSYDNNVLQARGARMLTNKESKYYNDLIDAMRQPNYVDAVRTMEKTLPETVLEDIFEGIENTHEVLKHVDLQHVGLKTRIVYAVDDNVKATWGKVTDAITAEASGAFEDIDASALKLSAYIAVPEALLDLGPVYLDRYVRTVLYNSIANGLEDGFINGTGAGAPVGMVADLTQGTVNAGVTTYATKTAVEVETFDAEGLATVFATMAKNRSGNPRKLDGLFMIVNPTTYYNKILPAIGIRTATGEYSYRTPIPMEIVQSSYVADNKAVMGISKRYVGALCTAEAGTIQVSDDVKFLDDARTFKIRLLGNGCPKDNNSFVVLDVAGLKPVEYVVVNVNTTAESESE